MTRRVAVIGGAASPCGKLQTAADAPLQSLEHEILAPLVIDAMATAGLPKEEVGALVFAMCRPYTLQKYFATFMANYLRLPLKGTIMEVLGNGMTGGMAFDEAVNAVALGHADVGLALGINMESQANSAEHMMTTMRAVGDVDFHSIFGFTPISWYAMDAMRYMHEFGATRAELASVAVKDRVKVNDLQIKIFSALKEVHVLLPTTLETASATISKLFTVSTIPDEIASAIRYSYTELCNRPSRIDEDKSVAVRSSATAEDLPEASFAGQQETYLNICGINAVLDAIKKCWASLWTARAIAYRIKNNIDQNAVALAVVVQEMVNAETAGILFTANPMNGHRDEMVINASWGLGEAIVGGLVSPDTIVADKTTGKVKKMDVAEKTIITVATASGTEEKPLTDARRRSQVLKDAQVAELVYIARTIETLYGRPQDIEWCCTGGQFYIVQSRPITALPEPEISAPAEWRLPKGCYAVMRNNIVELMAAPLSPLFATLGLSAINTSLARLMNESFGMRGIMPNEIVIVVNHYAYNNGSVSLKSMARMIFGAGKIMKMMFTGAVERWTENGRQRYYQTVEGWQAKNWRSFPSVELISSVKQLTESAIDAYGALISGVIPAAWIKEFFGGIKFPSATSASASRTTASAFAPSTSRESRIRSSSRMRCASAPRRRSRSRSTRQCSTSRSSVREPRWTECRRSASSWSSPTAI